MFSKSFVHCSTLTQVTWSNIKCDTSILWIPIHNDRHEFYFEVFYSFFFLNPTILIGILWPPLLISKKLSIIRLSFSPIFVDLCWTKCTKITDWIHGTMQPGVLWHNSLKWHHWHCIEDRQIERKSGGTHENSRYEVGVLTPRVFSKQQMRCVFFNQEVTVWWSLQRGSEIRGLWWDTSGW